MNDDTTRDDCDFCEGNRSLDTSAAPRERVLVTPAWRVIAHRSALQGWMLLVPRRHIESLHELTVDEAAELGVLIRDATETLIKVCGAQKSYVMQFAEGIRHAHFSLVPRMANLPTDRIGAKISAYNSADDPMSDSQRDEIAYQLTAAWPVRQ